ncbi:farnesyltransferase alpha subunit [Capsaspora owczarzaki ATCC 30864]|uniref:farnesyltransferase alpha subunit n=1 Tax=Capsaspora owczarzaki (strain ATCC 30864) TaxID=595528 RepID=UPI0003521B1D|nr:farnesyltransferase alpha subunit [Capsaspora owczarzaki ATCC 30864]|eukprot:XP_004348074.2 farnesyltransferase alpha subunit [Capsaspora owczarzaki ATCC 30864]
MSDSEYESDSDSETYVFFKDRPQWADVKPLEQDDGPDPVVAILYADEFKDKMNYFRAIVQLDERSQRAFDLTTEVIKANPANYHAWHFRRLVMDALNLDYQPELAFTHRLAEANPKNYQIWHHRRVVAEKIRSPSNELEFTATQLDHDAKNYHAWTHRHWVVEAFGLWDGQLDYSALLLQRDVRNNSAWNYRYWILSKTNGLDSLAKIDEQLAFAFALIRKAPNNESAWNFVRGVASSRRFGDTPSIEAFCTDLSKSPVHYPYCLGLQVEIQEEKALAGNRDALLELEKLCDKLGNEVDTIRAKYWNYRKVTVRERCPQ